MNKPLKNEIIFQAAIAGLLAGDFSHLAPLFADDAPAAGQFCAILACLVVVL